MSADRAAPTGITKDFYSGLSLSLAAMLSLTQVAVALSGSRGSWIESTRVAIVSTIIRSPRVTGVRFLWDAHQEPDLPLLQAAAERGELSTRSGYERQVDRMLASGASGDGGALLLPRFVPVR